jgi:DNA-binding NtrC family response regulator
MLMNRPRILVVDDEIDFSTGLREVFSFRGYDVETVSDGLAALSMIAANPFDAIILDVRMPGMDGMQVLHRILHLAPQTPTILMTGDHLLSDSQAKSGYGAFAYLLKPYPILDLVALIDKAVAGKRTPQSLPFRCSSSSLRSEASAIFAGKSPTSSGIIA